MASSLRMHAERTPNPDSIKWVLGEPIVEAGVHASFGEAVDLQVSPLAARLFAVDGVARVFLAANFVTVTKEETRDWADLAEPLVAALQEFVHSGEAALGSAFEATVPAQDNEVVRRIQKILEEEVRPAVTMDGGDVVFAGYRDGVVEVYLQGACIGCPSATATLKFGIEARLREEIAEVREVVAL